MVWLDMVAKWFLSVAFAVAVISRRRRLIIFLAACAARGGRGRDFGFAKIRETAIARTRSFSDS